MGPDNQAAIRRQARRPIILDAHCGDFLGCRCRTDASPDVLMPGPYPAWDLEPLAATYTLHKLWEAEDRQRFIAERAPSVRAIATRGELGANAEPIAALPRLEIIACHGVGTDPSTLPQRARAASA